MSISKPLDYKAIQWYTQWIINARLNGLLMPPIRSVHDLLPDLDDRGDLIVCGSGPSLNDDLEKLRTDPSIIVANHSNLATLLYHHINPDYVLITDAGQATYDRLANDVLPHWGMPWAKFILPTHANPSLVSLLRSYKIEPYFFVNIAQALKQSPEQDRYNDILQVMTPSLVYYDETGEGVVPCMAQCGCVSNASVIFAQFLAMNGQPLKNVYLTGVDYSFPDGRNRCTNVTWNDKGKFFNIDHNPERNEADPPLMKLNGLDTDPVQYAYYNDLRYIASTIMNDDPKLFDIFTTSKNFLSDFLEVRPL